MYKYNDLNEKNVKKLRRKYRLATIMEQREVHKSTLNSSSFDEHDGLLFRRVKLLSRFYVLNKAYRMSNTDSVWSLKDLDLNFGNKLKCNTKNPLCYYDFTGRSKILHFLTFRTTEPVKIIDNYFGEETMKTHKRRCHNSIDVSNLQCKSIIRQ